MVHALYDHTRDIELATNMFINLSKELDDGLEIIDPALAVCCHALYQGKFDFLNYMSNAVQVKSGGPRLRLFLKRPLGQMQLVDMEAMYQQSKAELASGAERIWPSASAFDAFTKDFEEVSFDFEDESIATELYDMIVRQNTLLKEARESLRLLLKENFSVEEILFQSEKGRGR